MKRAEIEALIGKRAAHGVGMWLDLVRVPPSGTWERRRADLYGLAETWLGPPDIDRDAALDHLVTPLPDRLRARVHGRHRQLGRAVTA